MPLWLIIPPCVRRFPGAPSVVACAWLPGRTDRKRSAFAGSVARSAPRCGAARRRGDSRAASRAGTALVPFLSSAAAARSASVDFRASIRRSGFSSFQRLVSRARTGTLSFFSGTSATGAGALRSTGFGSGGGTGSTCVPSSTSWARSSSGAGPGSHDHRCRPRLLHFHRRRPGRFIGIAGEAVIVEPGPQIFADGDRVIDDLIWRAMGAAPCRP